MNNNADNPHYPEMSFQPYVIDERYKNIVVMSVLLRRKRWRNFDKGLFANPLIQTADKQQIKELKNEQQEYIKYLQNKFQNIFPEELREIKKENNQKQIKTEKRKEGFVDPLDIFEKIRNQSNDKALVNLLQKSKRIKKEKNEKLQKKSKKNKESTDDDLLNQILSGSDGEVEQSQEDIFGSDDSGQNKKDQDDE